MEDVTIIGAGPAGIACAIQLSRQGIRPLLLEGATAGGLLRNALLVENYPGFPQGISGPELVALFLAQLKRVGVTPWPEKVLSLDYAGDHFILRTDRATTASRIVVVASGTRPIAFDPDRITADAAALIHYEIHSLASETGKSIVIVGAGDAACDYALNLARKNTVTILNRGTDWKCLPLLKERVARSEGIKYILQARVIKVHTGAGQGLLLQIDQAGTRQEVPADRLVFAIGREREVGFLSPSVQEMTSHLEREGLLYFIGDVKNGIFRQTALAVGDGVKAALLINKKLREM